MQVTGLEDSDPRRVDRTRFSVASLREADDELEYWLSRTPEERLHAVELLRQTLYGYDPATARLKKVLTVARRGDDG